MHAMTPRRGGCCCAVRWLPVILIVAMLGWSYYAYVIYLCAYSIQNVPEKVLYMIIYHILFLACVTCYIRTAAAKSSLVPSQFYFGVEDMQRLNALDLKQRKGTILALAKNLAIQQRTAAGELRYCDVCQSFKPDRTHHCSVCTVCVLKMDHHCNWVNNCVSFSNYKFFILLLVYALLLTVFVTATSLQFCIQFWMEFGEPQQKAEDVQFFLLSIISFISFIFVTALLTLHVRLLLTNRTTLEWFRTPVFESGQLRSNAFNLGTYNNFLQVFGNKAVLWLLPVFSGLGNGSQFSVTTVSSSAALKATKVSNMDMTPLIKTKTVLVQPPGSQMEQHIDDSKAGMHSSNPDTREIFGNTSHPKDNG